MKNEDYEIRSVGINKFSITKYNGIDEEVVIPSIIDGENVIVINQWAFFGKKNLKKVVIQDGISTIDYCAFRECINLKEVYLPNSIEYIGPEAFGYIDNVKIHFPDKPINIAPNAITEDAFELNKTVKGNGEYLGSILWNVIDKDVTKFVVPKECKLVEVDIFYNCGNLETIEFEDGCDAYLNWFSDEPLYYYIGNLREIRTGYHFNSKLGLQILEYAIEYDKPTMVLEKYTNAIKKYEFDFILQEAREKNRVGILALLIEFYHNRFGGDSNLKI